MNILARSIARWLAIAALSCFPWLPAKGLAMDMDADVAVHGATPAGIAAAISAAKGGLDVVLIEPTGRIGGLLTSGLSHSDFHSFESLSGSFLEFSRRVEAYYVQHHGEDSPQARDCFRGTFGEPKVNLAVLETMLAEHPRIQRKLKMTIAEVVVSLGSPPRRIESIALVDALGHRAMLRAKHFIDASYEGDLMAKAGVAYRVGREAREEYGESLASARGDAELQAYNFRFIMTRDPANRVAPVAPTGYRRDDFLGVSSLLNSGAIDRVFGYPRGCLFKAQEPPLPHGKYDINDVSGGIVRLSLPGRNLGWPEGDAAARRAIFDDHLRDQAGLVYFLQNDPSVPQRFRDEARQWGWCRDEFTESNHLPPQLYVREARRMVGVKVYTQKDSEHAPGDARAVLHRDAIAMGDYGNNCHGTGHDGPRFGGRHVGEFYHVTPPYQIPLGVLLSREVENLLVPVAASSSHVGFCALRLEPIWMSLGQAAGHAAAQALEDEVPLGRVDVGRLQARLHADRSATIYVADVAPDAADFGLIQWWGSAGGLHGLAATPPAGRVRGENLHGQYFEAYPRHEVEMNRVLDPALGQRWNELAKSLGLDIAKLPAADGKVSRGDFLHAAWRARPTP